MAASDSGGGPPRDGENGDASDPTPAELTLPGVPDTKAPFQFNTQINVQQIPRTAWDRLSPEQVLSLSTAILQNADTIDKRHFDFAMAQAKRIDDGKKLGMRLGTAIAIVGYLVSAYLAYLDQSIVSAVIAASITTALAMIVGNRFLD